jgi:hypothetical protein
MMDSKHEPIFYEFITKAEPTAQTTVPQPANSVEQGTS